MNPSELVFPVVATIAQLLPPAAVLPMWRRAPLARRWIAVWCVAFFVSDLLQIGVASSLGNNLWLLTFIEPVEDALLLWSLSYWQTRPITRIAFRVAIPLVIGIYLTISFAAGELNTFKTFSGPFRALLLLVATAFTLISNVSAEPERVYAKDWLWTCLGVLLYFGLLVSTDPIIAAMGPKDLELMRRLLNVRAAGDVFSYVLIWKGMRCPLPTSSSGSI